MVNNNMNPFVTMTKFVIRNNVSNNFREKIFTFISRVIKKSMNSLDNRILLN